MYLLKCLLLKCILIFFISCCLCENEGNAESLDCNCDVQIDVVKNVLQKLQKLEKLVEEIKARNETKPEGNLKRTPANCLEAAAGTFKSGIYNIQIVPLGDSNSFEVWCDEETDFGGWTVIQRRISAAEDFYRGWGDYKKGFGNLTTNFWLGLDKLHALTTSCEHELYIKMERFNGKKYFAKYDRFVVGSETEGFILKNIGKYKGTAEDYLQSHEGSKFSTHDRDNDENSDASCAKKWRGGWWYNSCYWSNLNGDYTKNDSGEGLVWIGIDRNESLKFVQMMIRPTDSCIKRLALRF
ncbi:unnamed protein product [Ceratitis capitata]|uniref:(Mediterranean fruit fly) hypothetical protein n=2 Tax=Ceratitis capitata TaxID=7213 RepID=A0A811V285_CERCA|nr:unnamed protein product [Ceratitis capitata]